MSLCLCLLPYTKLHGIHLNLQLLYHLNTLLQQFILFKPISEVRVFSLVLVCKVKNNEVSAFLLQNIKKGNYTRPVDYSRLVVSSSSRLVNLVVVLALVDTPVCALCSLGVPWPYLLTTTYAGLWRITPPLHQAFIGVSQDVPEQPEFWAETSVRTKESHNTLCFNPAKQLAKPHRCPMFLFLCNVCVINQIWNINEATFCTTHNLYMHDFVQGNKNGFLELNPGFGVFVSSLPVCATLIYLWHCQSIVWLKGPNIIITVLNHRRKVEVKASLWKIDVAWTKFVYPWSQLWDIWCEWFVGL